MKTVKIKEDIGIPGTNIVLETNDKILYRESTFGNFLKANDFRWSRTEPSGGETYRYAPNLKPTKLTITVLKTKVIVEWDLKEIKRLTPNQFMKGFSDLKTELGLN